MFYIIDNNADFQRSGRFGQPSSLCMNGARDYADRFRTKAEAEQMLAYWKSNNDFKGRVIDHQTALEMGDVYDA